MNFLKRAIRYCWRQKIRSILLLLVFTLLASAALIALSVGHATAEGTEEVKQTVGASIRVEIDGDNPDNFGSPTQNEYGLTYQYNGDYITQEVIDAIIRNESVYFAAVGGAGALLSKCIKRSEVVAYDDLGAEAIRRLEIENFPVIVVIDKDGNNLYETAIEKYRKRIEEN